jgi:hypothetical protein
MPYMGVRARHETVDLTIKLHGPNVFFPIRMQELGEKVKDLLMQYKGFRTQEVCSLLSKELIEIYGGEDVVWTQVESISSSGAMYGSSAEKV